MTHRNCTTLRGLAVGLVAVLSGAAWAQDTEPGAASPNPLWSVSKDSLTAFRTRPLFSPTRAEPATIASQAAPVFAAPPSPPSAPPAMRLVGLVGGTNKFAVVRLGDGTKAQILGTGDKLGGWDVTVLDSGIRLALDGRSVDVALFNSGLHGKGPMQKPGMPPAPPPDVQGQ